MRCSRCAREIPDGSRFCGLCGGKQSSGAVGDPKAETMVGGAAASVLAARGRSATLVGGLAGSEVVAGGRRFAALSAGPAAASVPSTPPLGVATPAVTDTLSEGVPAGAMAALLAAHRPKADTVKARPIAKATPKTAPKADPVEIPAPKRARGPAATLIGGPALLRSATQSAPPTEPDRPAIPADDTAESLPPAPADLVDLADGADADLAGQTEPRLPAASPDLIDKTEQSLPPAAADLVAQMEDTPSSPAPIAADAQAAPDDATPTLKRRRRRVAKPMPSVIVDSEFGREAQAVVAELSRPPARSSAPAIEASAPPASVEATPDAAETAQDAPAAPDAPEAAPRKGGFRETAWFLDALDAEALSRAETDDIQARQAQNKAGIDRANQLDESTRRQYSLRSNDSLPAHVGSATQVSDSAPAAVDRQSPLIGLIIFVVVALGVAGWFLFGQ